MTDVIAIPVQPLAALFFAALMSLNAILLAGLLEDDIPHKGYEILIGIGGWLWWAVLLWMVVGA